MTWTWFKLFENGFWFDNGFKQLCAEMFMQECSVKGYLDYTDTNNANKDSYPHNSTNQCIILRLQLSFVMINVQLMLV